MALMAIDGIETKTACIVIVIGFNGLIENIEVLINKRSFNNKRNLKSTRVNNVINESSKF